jgi:hypothetical protein
VVVEYVVVVAVGAGVVLYVVQAASENDMANKANSILINAPFIKINFSIVYYPSDIFSNQQQDLLYLAQIGSAQPLICRRI